MDATAKLPIRECVKASYNSACSGTYIGVDVLKYVLSRGCRYLDLRFIWLIMSRMWGSPPTVRHHANITSTTITLNDALDHKRLRVLLARAQRHRPLFINLRPQSCGTTRTRRGCIVHSGGHNQHAHAETYKRQDHGRHVYTDRDE
jgi:hypothetical protein